MNGPKVCVGSVHGTAHSLNCAFKTIKIVLGDCFLAFIKCAQNQKIQNNNNKNHKKDVKNICEQSQNIQISIPIEPS